MLHFFYENTELKFVQNLGTMSVLAIGIVRIFDWGAKPQIALGRHYKFSKDELFVGQRYRRMEDQKRWLVLGT